MYRNRLFLALLALAPCAAIAAAVSAADNLPAADNQCVECHQDPDYFVGYPKLHKYYQQWLGSPHQQANVTCDDCHGGEPDAETAAEAHAGVLPMNDVESSLYFRNQPETCGQCHSAIRAQFVKSRHFAALSGQRAAPTCTTCHPAMSKRPDFQLIVLNACQNCHGPGNSENLPLITGKAENLFHQLNIAEGLMAWTRIHYESQGWPDDSRDRMRELDARHRKILDWVHQFHLEETELATREMLDDLRAVFEDARRAHEQRARD